MWLFLLIGRGQSFLHGICKSLEGGGGLWWFNKQTWTTGEYKVVRVHRYMWEGKETENAKRHFLKLPWKEKSFVDNLSSSLLSLSMGCTSSKIGLYRTNMAGGRLSSSASPHLLFFICLSSSASPPPFPFPIPLAWLSLSPVAQSLAGLSLLASI